MTTIGAAVMILAIGLFIFVMLRGGCCGRPDNRRQPPESGRIGNADPETGKRPGGGCCG